MLQNLKLVLGLFYFYSSLICKESQSSSVSIVTRFWAG